MFTHTHTHIGSMKQSHNRQDAYWQHHGPIAIDMATSVVHQDLHYHLRLL